MIKYIFFLLLNVFPLCHEFSYAQANNIPISAFIEASKYKGVALSPDGDRYFVVSVSNNKALIQVLSNPYSKEADQQQYNLSISLLSTVSWLSNHQIIVAYTLINKNSKNSIKGFVREWVLIDTKDSTSSKFLSYPVNLMIANKQASLIHSLPDEPDYVLISFPEKKKNYPAIFKVNIHTGAKEKIVKAQKPITSWLVNRDGKPLMGYGASEDEIKILIRNNDKGLLEDISDKPLFKNGYFTPLEQGITDKTIYVSSSIGDGRKKIYHYDYENNIILSKIFEHPKVDAENIIYSYADNKLIAAYYIDDNFQYSFFDDKFEELYNKATQKLLDKNIRILNYSENSIFSIIAAGNDHSPTDFYIYNKQKDEMKLLAGNSKSLRGYNLVSVKPITYFSRDGLEIHSYLTNPLTNNGPKPGIIMPHGGPWVRDMLSYNDWAQFFASRGYAVLQPNFRGSTGYGNVFTNISNGEWGGKMQNDLTDGVKWLINEKIVDPDKICIVGGSYGGYAALMGVIKDPDLYKCAISFAPVTDINAYLNTYKRFPDQSNLKNMVMGQNKKSFLIDRSPSKQAKKIKVPILLVHGNSDIRVDIKHSQYMIKALKKAKKEYQFIELENGSHFLLSSEHKIKLFQEMEAFLKKNLM